MAAPKQSPHSWKRDICSTDLEDAPGVSRLMPSKLRSCFTVRAGGDG